MTSLTSVVTRERGALAGDACLVTAAFGVVMGAVALTFVPDGVQTEGIGWVSLLSAVLSLAVLILGPLVAWRLHRRRLTRIAVLGAVVGGFVGGFAVLPLAMLSAAVGWLASWVSSSEFAGPITILVLVSLAFVALLTWLVADGMHDLAPSRRGHPRLDVVRLISAAVLVAFAIGVALWAARHPGDESGEAIIFAMATGVGAAVVTGAEVATSLAARGKTVSGPGR